MTEPNSENQKIIAQREKEFSKNIKKQFKRILNKERYQIFFVLRVKVPKNIAEDLNYKIYTEDCIQRIGYKNLKKLKVHVLDNKKVFEYEYDELQSLDIKFTFFEWYATQYLNEKSINYTLKRLIGINGQQLEFTTKDLNDKFRTPIGLMVIIFTEPQEEENSIALYFKCKKDPIKYSFMKKSCIALFFHLDQIQLIDFQKGNFLVAIYNIFAEKTKLTQFNSKDVSFIKNYTLLSVEMQRLALQKYLYSVKTELLHFNEKFNRNLCLGYFIVHKLMIPSFENISMELLNNTVGIDREICLFLTTERINLKLYFYFEEIADTLFEKIPFDSKAENLEKSIIHPSESIFMKNTIFINDKQNAAKFFVGKYYVKDPYYSGEAVCERNKLTSKSGCFMVKRYCSIAVIF